MRVDSPIISFIIIGCCCSFIIAFLGFFVYSLIFVVLYTGFIELLEKSFQSKIAAKERVNLHDWFEIIDETPPAIKVAFCKKCGHCVCLDEVPDYKESKGCVKNEFT